MIIVFTGRGKGKTSAALATAVRALIAGKRVAYIQFLKSKGNAASHLKEYFKGLDFYSFGTKAFVDPENPSEEAKEKAKKAFTLAKKLIKEKDLLVLDELNVALLFKLLDLKEVLEFLKEYKMKETKTPKPYSWPIIVITGIDAKKEIVDIADLVTEMKEIKHPFKKGYLATRGIDF